ncbi:MAG: phosphate signaling complex protein PhoU [Myxococcota bacterium]
MARKDDPMVHTPHLDLAYERELHAISNLVSTMADAAQAMVGDAVRALLTHDLELGSQIAGRDEHLDGLETRCDDACIQLMARRAPVGRDLRFVTGVLKLVADLERIGDLAVNVVKRDREIEKLRPLPTEVVDLANSVIAELALALTALKTRDATLARRLRSEDHATDARNRAAFDRLLQVCEDSGKFNEVLAVTNVCRHLERIGDHAVNVAEMVVYMVEGKVMRHNPDV